MSSPNECCLNTANLVTPDLEAHQSPGPWPHISEDGDQGYSLHVECLECGREYKLYYEFTQAWDLQTETVVDGVGEA